MKSQLLETIIRHSNLGFSLRLNKCKNDILWRVTSLCIKSKYAKYAKFIKSGSCLHMGRGIIIKKSPYVMFPVSHPELPGNIKSFQRASGLFLQILAVLPMSHVQGTFYSCSLDHCRLHFSQSLLNSKCNVLFQNVTGESWTICCFQGRFHSWKADVPWKKRTALDFWSRLYVAHSWRSCASFLRAWTIIIWSMRTWSAE